MLIAGNFLKLIFLIVLGFLYLIGQGWLVIGPLVHGSLLKRKSDISYFQELFLLIISGLIINYMTVLIFQSLDASFFYGCILAIIGICLFFLMLARSLKRKKINNNSYKKLFGLFIICTLFIGPIFVLPISEWDARSIWFLHGKMIYFAGSFSKDSGWLHPSVYFSHTDYPKLIPILAAQVTYVMGIWNEYLPKSSLFFLFVPAISALMTFYRRSFSFLFLIIIIPFSFAGKLWIGYMDGYITLYFALSMLLLGRYFKSTQPVDLISSVLSLVVLLFVKNEGALALFTGVLTIVIILILKKNQCSIRFIFSNWKYFVILLLFLLPFGLWSYYKSQWGLVNDLAIGSKQSFMQLLERLNDGSYKIIIDSIHDQINSGLMILGFLFFISLALKIKIPQEIFPIIGAALVYCMGILIIYLITPNDLVWHLKTSVDRTILTSSVVLFVASYYLLINLEKSEVIFELQEKYLHN